MSGSPCLHPTVRVKPAQAGQGTGAQGMHWSVVMATQESVAGYQGSVPGPTPSNPHPLEPHPCPHLVHDLDSSLPWIFGRPLSSSQIFLQLSLIVGIIQILRSRDPGCRQNLGRACRHPGFPTFGGGPSVGRVLNP